jgi:hypothetical protein
MKKSPNGQQEQQPSMPQRIKVKLDSKTTIIINKISSLNVWKKRYPLAHVIS